MWPEERRRELAELRDLIAQCKAINSANNILERLDRIIEVAEFLTATDLIEQRKSFLEFLVEEATRDE